MRSVEPSVADERKEEEDSLAKLEWLVVLIYVTDTTDERRYGRIEAFESLNGDWTRGIGQHTQKILSWLILIFAVLNNQLKVIVQENEDGLSFLNPGQEPDLLVGPIHGDVSHLPCE